LREQECFQLEQPLAVLFFSAPSASTNAAGSAGATSPSAAAIGLAPACPATYCANAAARRVLSGGLKLEQPLVRAVPPTRPLSARALPCHLRTVLKKTECARSGPASGRQRPHNSVRQGTATRATHFWRSSPSARARCCSRDSALMHLLDLDLMASSRVCVRGNPWLGCWIILSAARLTQH